jgi:hypothetical protein
VVCGFLWLHSGETRNQLAERPKTVGSCSRGGIFIALPKNDVKQFVREVLANHIERGFDGGEYDVLRFPAYLVAPA